MQLPGRVLALAALGACCLLVVMSTQLTSAQETTDTSNGQQQQQQSSSNTGGRGIFSMLFSPLRATMEQAKRLLGRRLSAPIERAEDLVVDGFNGIQTRTFKMFMSLYNKTYSAEEIPRRMALFFERRRKIEQSVRDFAAGKLSFVMRENAFVDWDEDEIKMLSRASPPKSLDEMTAEERQAVSELRQEGQNDEAKLELADNSDEPASVSRAFDLGEPASDHINNFYPDQRDEDEDSEFNLTVRATERIPASKDWRNSGCVSTPINQLKCGACYAIATMSVVESARCIGQVSSPILAPQQIVDCSTPSAGYQNYGCDGGWPTRVLKYLQDVRVAARESCYPFVRRQNRCRLNSVKAIDGCTVSPSASNSQLRYRVLNNERDILYHVAKTGPVVTVMRATDKFLYYGSGIFDDPSCSRKRDDVDHAIVIAGYGRENNQDYWLIKNSWGTTDWGEEGYAKYKRGTNACSIGHWGWVVTG